MLNIEDGIPQASQPSNPTVEELEEQIRVRYKWRKIKAPQVWRPEVIGQEVVGFYGGQTVRDGKWGQYRIVIVHTPLVGSYTLSGAAICNLVDASAVPMGHPVRIVWQGHKDLGDGRTLKMYELFVADEQTIMDQAANFMRRQ